MNKTVSPVRITMTAIFIALIIVCSWISVPTPYGVPFTLQTFAVILAGLMLAPLDALTVGAVYLLMGLAGLPIFAGFGNLYAKIGMPTGGYIIGFFIAPFIISLVKTALLKIVDASSLEGARLKTARLAVYILTAVIVGTLVVDIPGVIQLKLVTNMDMTKAIYAGAVMFLPFDAAKAVLAAVVCASLEKPLKKLL